MRKNSWIIIAVFLAIALFLFSFEYRILSREVVPATFILSEVPGMGHMDDVLLFGKIQENQSASRTLVVENDFYDSVFIKIKATDDLKNNLIVSENNFYLNSGEARNITFTVYTNGLTEYREYSGDIIITSRKA